MKVGRATIILFWAVGVMAGCALNAATPSAPTAQREESGSTYRAVFDHWTREGRIYDGLDVKLISAATYLSDAFRLAFATEYALRYRMTDLEKEKLIQDQKDAAAAYEDFIFAAYVPEKAWDDFDKKNSIWKIFITTDRGNQIKPIEIRKLDKRDAKTAYFYAYVTPWKSIYRLRFPKLTAADYSGTAGAGFDSFKLVVTSVLGSAEMAWRSKP